MAAITLEWRGKTYTIPDTEAFEVGEKVEDVFPLTSLATMADRPNFHRIARAYAVMLAHAGADVTSRDVHAHIMEGLAGAGKGERLAAAHAALAAIVAVLTDGMPVGDVGQSAGGNAPSSSEGAT